MILLLLALHCGDSFHLRYEARAVGLPDRRVEAIARVETACNLNPRLRAHDCRAPRRDCEVGRFQIKPSTARQRCSCVDVRTYRNNVACFLLTFAEDRARFGLTDATVRHNGYGPAGAYEYLYKVLKVEEGLP